MDAYDYGLPSTAIAQQPIEPRTAARLLIGPGVDGNVKARHSAISALPSLLRTGDVMVVNRTRVLTARLELRTGNRWCGRGASARADPDG